MEISHQLVVDLTSQHIEMLPLPETPSFAAELGLHLYRDSNSDLQEARIIITPGPLAHVSGPGVQRLIITTHSPLTGRIVQVNLEASDAFLQACARHKLRAIHIRGRAQSPIALGLSPEPQLISVSQVEVQNGNFLFHINPQAPGDLCALYNTFSRNVAPGTGLGAAFHRHHLTGIFASPGSVESPEPSPHFTDILRLIAANPALLGEFGFTNHTPAAVYDLLAVRNIIRPPYHNLAALTCGRSLDALPECPGCPVQCHKRIGATDLPVPHYLELHAINTLLIHPNPEAFQALYQMLTAAGVDPVPLAAALPPDHPPVTAQNLQQHLSNWQRPHTRCLTIPPLQLQHMLPTTLALFTEPGGPVFQHTPTWNCELLRKPFPIPSDDLTTSIPLIVQQRHLLAAFDLLGVCPYLALAVGPEEIAQLHTRLTRSELSAAQLLAYGRRLVDQRVALNSSHSQAVDITSPIRETLPLETVEKVDRALEQYHQLRMPSSTCAKPEHIAITHPAIREIVQTMHRAHLADSQDITLAFRQHTIVTAGRRTRLAETLLQQLPANTVLIAMPTLRYRLPATALAQDHTFIAPNDSETRTLLHRIP
ncbi:MAG: hypothetical protein D6820_16705, partial [Lentisphaerae bacterium]